MNFDKKLDLLVFDLPGWDSPGFSGMICIKHGIKSLIVYSVFNEE